MDLDHCARCDRQPIKITTRQMCADCNDLRVKKEKAEMALDSFLAINDMERKQINMNLHFQVARQFVDGMYFERLDKKQLCLACNAVSETTREETGRCGKCEYLFKRKKQLEKKAAAARNEFDSGELRLGVCCIVPKKHSFLMK